MALAKKILGVVGIIFGAIGVLLAILAIAASWAVNKPVRDVALDLLDTAEAALVTVDNVLERTDNGLQEARNTISDVAEAIPGTELAARIDGLLGLVEAAAVAADNANTIVGTTNKVSNLFQRDDPDAPETKLDKLSAGLDDLSMKLAEIDQHAKDLQERDVAGEIATQIDGEIASVQDGVNDIANSVDEAQTTVADLQIAVPGWIDTASVILTIQFIWMGVAQFALAAYGWRWFKGDSTVKEEPPALAAGPVLVDEGSEPKLVDEEAASESSTAVIDEGEKPSEEKSVDEMPEVDETGLRNEIKQFQDEAEKLIEARGRENYAAAAGNLKQAKDLYEELGQRGEWETYISDLKARNSRMRALQEELEEVGL